MRIVHTYACKIFSVPVVSKCVRYVILDAVQNNHILFCLQKDDGNMQYYEKVVILLISKLGSDLE